MDNSTPSSVTLDPEKGISTPDAPSVVEEPAPEITHLTGLKLYITLGSIVIVGFLITLDASIIVTAIPRITAHFNSIADIGWYGSAYMISNCVCQLNSGKIYQHHSLKITFLIFLSIFELGSLLCGVATSSMMLIIGRAIAGVGGSGLMNGGFTIIAVVSPQEKRPFYLGIVMAFIMLGLVAGPLLGGIITQYSSWRWCFYINLPIGALSAVIVLFTHFPSRKPTSTASTPLSSWEIFKRLDPIGFVTFAPSCIMLLLALQWGGTTYAWKSATIIGLFLGSLATFCIFVTWEYHIGDKAMMPLTLLKRRIVYSSCLASMGQFGGMQLLAYYLPLWFQVIKGASPSMSGVYFMGTIGPQIVLAIMSGALISKFGYYTPWAIGGNLLSAIGSGLLSTLSISSNAGKYIGYQILCGLARGCVQQQPLTAVQTNVAADQISVGIALVVFTQFFGSAIFIAFAQTTFTNSLGPALREFAPNVSAKFVIDTGATNLRDVIGAAELNGVLMAYNQALTHTFYLAAGTAAVAFIASWGMGWVNVRKVKETSK
ncbi:efflux pump [Hyaloscypha hepaticicola]|uniref:Efflux pump n=1 Tax=Hyaloscypha hepaticicola TaxID=2082293 RepID=A0A2J6PZF5_9HELO|nr:efflux pump [Hyaloscypha hepaticicola]